MRSLAKQILGSYCHSIIPHLTPIETIGSCRGLLTHTVVKDMLPSKEEHMWDKLCQNTFWESGHRHRKRLANGHFVSPLFVVMVSRHHGGAIANMARHQIRVWLTQNWRLPLLAANRAYQSKRPASVGGCFTAHFPWRPLSAIRVGGPRQSGAISRGHRGGNWPGQCGAQWSDRQGRQGLCPFCGY